MESFDEYVARYTRAIEEARRRGPAPLTGETYPVGVESRVERMDRARIEAILQNVCPRGVGYLYHHLNVTMVNIGDFDAACDHFGLRGAIRDISPEEVAEEVRARRASGAEASDGLLPARLDEVMPREEADARIAIVGRRIARAREIAAAPAAQGRAGGPRAR